MYKCIALKSTSFHKPSGLSFWTLDGRTTPSHAFEPGIGSEGPEGCKFEGARDLHQSLVILFSLQEIGNGFQLLFTIAILNEWKCSISAKVGMEVPKTKNSAPAKTCTGRLSLCGIAIVRHPWMSHDQASALRIQ